MNKFDTKSVGMLLMLAASPFAAMGFLAQAGAQDIEPALEASQQAVAGTRESQERIDEIDSRIQALLGDYRANLRQLEQLNRYNASQERQVAAQRQEIESLTEDINNIASLQRAVQPLMQDMVDSLAEVVEADLPFLLDERRARIDRLRGLMEDPASSPAQRYRMIIEAHQIEAEYGRTIEGYRSDIQTEERMYENVDVLRIGRFVLIFKTDNDEVLKRFDPETRRWVDLDKSFMPDVKTAMRVAREQIPPELLYVPVRAPQTADEG